MTGAPQRSKALAFGLGMLRCRWFLFVPLELLNALSKLLRIQPDHVRGLSFKGDLLAATGKTAEAFALYQKAIDAYEKKYHRSNRPPSLSLKICIG